MGRPIFQISQKKYTGPSSVISMRLPKDMLADIDEAARVSGRTRNELLTMGLEFALNHLIVTTTEKEKEYGNFEVQDVRR